MQRKYISLILLWTISTIFFIFLFDSSSSLKSQLLLLQEKIPQLIKSKFQGNDIQWYIQKEYSSNNARLVNFNELVLYKSFFSRVES